jgi:hypothetical protein
MTKPSVSGSRASKSDRRRKSGARLNREVHDCIVRHGRRQFLQKSSRDDFASASSSARLVHALPVVEMTALSFDEFSDGNFGKSRLHTS